MPGGKKSKATQWYTPLDKDKREQIRSKATFKTNLTHLKQIKSHPFTHVLFAVGVHFKGSCKFIPFSETVLFQSERKTIMKPLKEQQLVYLIGRHILIAGAQQFPNVSIHSN